MVLSENQINTLTILISIIIGCILGTITFFIVKHIRDSGNSKKKVCEKCPTGKKCNTDTGNCETCSTTCLNCNSTNDCGESCSSMCSSPELCNDDGSCSEPSDCYKDDEDIFENKCDKGVRCCEDSKFCRKETDTDKHIYKYFCHKDTDCPTDSEAVRYDTTPECSKLEPNLDNCKRTGTQFCK
jgi:hypothetical protein